MPVSMLSRQFTVDRFAWVRCAKIPLAHLYPRMYYSEMCAMP